MRKRNTNIKSKKSKRCNLKYELKVTVQIHDFSPSKNIHFPGFMCRRGPEATTAQSHSTRPMTALNPTPRAGAGNTWTPGHTREQGANERQVSHSKDPGATLPNEDGTPRIHRP